MSEEDYQAGGVVQSQYVPNITDVSQVLQLTNTQGWLNDIEHELRMERRNAEGEWEACPAVKPLLSSEGIRRVMIILDGMFNHHISTGNLIVSKNQNMFKTLFCNLIRTVNRELTVNNHLYGISPENQHLVKSIILNPLYVYLSKAIQDKERGYIYPDKGQYRFQSMQPVSSKAAQDMQLYNRQK